MDEQEFRSVLARVAGERPIVGDLYRVGELSDVPERTGASVTLGVSAGQRWTEVHGIEGELPSNVRIEGDQVKISSESGPDDWNDVQGPDAEALRVFSLLDPRLVVDQLTRVEFLPDPTQAICHIDLISWKPHLPDAFLKWLEGDAYDRPVIFQLEGGRLVASSQPDLPPRRGDRIDIRFRQ